MTSLRINPCEAAASCCPDGKCQVSEVSDKCYAVANHWCMDQGVADAICQGCTANMRKGLRKVRFPRPPDGNTGESYFPQIYKNLWNATPAHERAKNWKQLVRQGVQMCKERCKCFGGCQDCDVGVPSECEINCECDAAAVMPPETMESFTPQDIFGRVREGNNGTSSKNTVGFWIGFIVVAIAAFILLYAFVWVLVGKNA